jgi:hypothetical protein
LAIKKEPCSTINEAAYAGNIGISELISFYRGASSKEKEEMQAALSTNDIKTFLRLIKLVVGVKLKSFNTPSMRK